MTSNLSDLSIDELKALRERWYNTALYDGSIAKVVCVVREFGTCRPKKHGSNWLWRQGDVEIVLDDYTGYTYVTQGKRLVMARTDTSRLFVPGPWMDVVRTAAGRAIARIEARRAQAAEVEKALLLRQLGGA